MAVSAKKVAGSNSASFICYRGGNVFPFDGIVSVSADLKAKEPFTTLTTGMAAGPVRLKSGSITRAIAVQLGSKEIDAGVAQVAKSVGLPLFRKNGLEWLTYSLIRQRPLKIVSEIVQFFVLPRQDARWADDVYSPPSASPPSSGAGQDGLASAMMTLADRMLGMPQLTDALTALHSNLSSLRSELKTLSTDLSGATGASLSVAEKLAAIGTDVKFAIAATTAPE